MQQYLNMVLNNKVHFILLPEDEQPKKTIFTPNAELLKFAKVLEVGKDVKDIFKDDIITIYVTSIQMINQNEGFCVDREPIFVNYRPRVDKVLITDIGKDSFNTLSKATVLLSSSDEINDNDIIYFKEGQSHILPDNTELISKSQIYYKD